MNDQNHQELLKLLTGLNNDVQEVQHTLANHTSHLKSISAEIIGHSSHLTSIRTELSDLRMNLDKQERHSGLMEGDHLCHDDRLMRLEKHLGLA